MRPKFEASDPTWTAGWEWAVAQAMAYVFSGDPVGDWIEAALPGRDAFCMRDVSHQSIGAQILGLDGHVKNMLHKFAENMAPSRDWCSYWEINKHDLPAPVDYTDDRDFWYNLPANFDLLDCCYRQYLWTGDPDYVQDPVFLRFYDRTVTDYVRQWDVDRDGLLEHLPQYGRRGLASYEEATFDIRLGGDLLAAQAAAYRAYARIQALRGDLDRAQAYERKAADLSALYETAWWNEETATFCSIVRSDGQLDPAPNFVINGLALYYGLVRDAAKAQHTLDDLCPRMDAMNVESLSYLPEIAYRYGRGRDASAALRRLIDPRLPRREYPEVSYSVIGTLVTGLIGLSCHTPRHTVSTTSHLLDQDSWVSIRDLSIGSNKVAIRHHGRTETTVHNQAGPDLTWQACFDLQTPHLVVDGIRQAATIDRDPYGQPRSWVAIPIPAGAARTVRVS